MKAIEILGVVVAVALVACGGAPFEQQSTGQGGASAQDDGGAPSNGGFAPAPGCMPDNTLCAESGSTDCVGWRCPTGTPAPTVPKGWGCAESNMGQFYACSPNALDGYVGDSAGNSCIVFRSNWCPRPATTVYLCPQTSTGPELNVSHCSRLAAQPVSGAVVWCCQ